MRLPLSVLVLVCVASSWGVVLGQADSIAVETYTSREEKEMHAQPDTADVVRQNFDSTVVNKLRSDSDLNYKENPTMAESLWDRFWTWVGEMLESLFRNVTGTNVGRVLLYTLGFIVVIAIIMALLKVNAFHVFYSGADKGKSGYVVFHENIHEMDFEKLIREAVENGEFRMGTRLIFLYALKLLADKHLVVWDPSKTNHDYVEELSASELKTGLNELSFYFDYAWYGNFVISRDVFGKVQGIFNEWKVKV